MWREIYAFSDAAEADMMNYIDSIARRHGIQPKPRQPRPLRERIVRWWRINVIDRMV